MFDICKFTVSTLLSLTMYWLKVDCCEVETINGIMSSGVYFENQLDSSEQCQRLCWYSKSCRSCSWGTRTGLCQLSNGTYDTNPDSFNISQHHIYTEAPPPPCLEVNHPCTNRPCSLTEICVPIEKVTSYVCLHMYSCITDCVGRPDGNYQCCDSCDVYCACSGQDLNKMPCPLTTVWDNNKRRCEDTSYTCTVNE